MVRVRLFGGLSVTVDGREVELPADARARELLARLALAPGPHTRSVLAGRLRPDVAEDSARKTLRSALYELRKAVGDAVAVDGDRIGLAGTVAVDAREFARLTEAGDLEAAVAVAQGDLLDGLDSEWALRARDEHTAALAGVLAELATRAEAAADLPAAVAWARRRLEVEPLAEAAHRDLIRLLALGGDRAAAVAAARLMADRLRTELGIAPSPATRALVEDVRRGQVAARAPAVVAGPPPLPPALAVAAEPAGRDAALDRLDETWRDVLSGVLRCAVVTGEAGIGKSTLAAAIARRAHAAGATVLLGRCDEHAILGFQPWTEALERVLEALPAGEADRWLTAHDGALARLLPAHATVAGTGGVEDGPRERFLAFELVRTLLGDLASRTPVLLVLDDVHWADPDSLLLLRHVVRALPKARLLVLLCARADEVGPAVGDALAALRREGPVAHIDLAGLDDAAVRAVLVRRLGVRHAEEARRYRERSGGNPFFLDELLRDAQETGRRDGPPAGVREVIGRRVARLGDATRRALDVAAVAGPAIDVTLVAAVDDRTALAVLEALDGALAAGLVVAGDLRGDLAFAHALVREAVLAALPVSARARLHLRIADVLADRGAGAGEVVRHLRAAGPLAAPDRLVTWELAAAREASAALAHADAAAHYEAALALDTSGGTTFPAQWDPKLGIHVT